MSKIICDVCGTTYPETAAQCPICSSAKNSSDQTAAQGGKTGDAETGGYNYVKGGRFSKKNVRKRTQKSGSASGRRSSSSSQEEPKNTGLIVMVVLLLLAIIAAVIYIAVTYFLPGKPSGNSESTGNTAGESSSQTAESTTQTPDPDNRVSCESLKLSSKYIEFIAEGETWTIIVERAPADTTDAVDFHSTNSDVATVSANGIVTAVGGGQAVIEVTCGDITETCVIVCSFGDPTEDIGDTPTETTESTGTGEFVFEFDTPFVDATTGYGDTTLSAQGANWKAYKSTLSVDPEDITWITDDPAVCTVENGIVTAVGPGKTKIHAQYNGVTYTCIVRCNFTVTQTGGSEDNGGDSGDENQAQSGSCTISHQDVTISVDETFKLTLTDGDGNVLEVTWTASGDNVSIDGNKITGVSSGKVEVSTTYEDVTYTCVVRVR